MWIFLLLALAAAHVPVFDDDLLERDIVGKSWGVYRELEKDESMLLRLKVGAGEELSFSVNLMGSMTFEPGTEYVNVTLYGHNTSQIVCEPDYTGWGRRLDVGLDQLRVFPTDTEDNGFHYEPFGVGLYRSLVACKGDAVVGDTFNLTITAKQDVTLSVGVGMAESFDLGDFATMSISLGQTWVMDGWSGWWFVFTIGLSLAIVYLMWETIYKGNMNKWRRREMALIHGFLLFSVLQFSSRLIQVTMYGGPITQPELGVTMIVHILLPLVVFVFLHKLCTCYRLPCVKSKYIRVNNLKYREEDTVQDYAMPYHFIMRLLLAVYSFFLVWQDFQLIPILMLVAAVGYGLVDINNEEDM